MRVSPVLACALYSVCVCVCLFEHISVNYDEDDDDRENDAYTFSSVVDLFALASFAFLLRQHK